MLLFLSACLALTCFLAVCFGLGELVFGWPKFLGVPAASPAPAEPDPTFCSYVYRAIGVGLALGLAVAIGIGLLTGTVWVGIEVAAFCGVTGLLLRLGSWLRRLRSDMGSANAPPDVSAQPEIAAAEAIPAAPWHRDLFGPARPVTCRDHRLLFLLVAVTFVFFLGAEFRVGHLFDPDGNDHAVCVRWLLDTGRLDEPSPAAPLLHYIDAYPPGFDIAAAALGRLTGDRAAFPLRLLTALVIALSVAWLFGLMVELTGRPRLALLATFFFVVAPNNLTSFIWSHALVISWVPLLTLEAWRLVRHSQQPDLPRARWFRSLASVALVLGGICLVSPVPGIKAIVWLGFVVLAALLSKRFHGARSLLMAGLLAGFVALIWWGPMFAKYKSYQALWRAQLAPTVVQIADTEHWTAPAATQVVGSGDQGINVGVNFWGWDRSGMGSETSATALSLGWPQTLFTLLGIGIAVGQCFGRWRATASRPADAASLPSPPSPPPSPMPALATADLLFGLLLLYTVLGLTGPFHGINFYAYRFALLLPITTAYFEARAVAVMLCAPRRFQILFASLIGLSFFATLFGFGLFLALSAGLGYAALLILIGAPFLGWATGAALVPPSAPGPTPLQPATPGGWNRPALLTLVFGFSLFAGGYFRYTLNYLPPVPNRYFEVGSTREVELIDSLPRLLPPGTNLYMAGGLDCHRLLIAQEMRAPLFEGLDEAALDRALQTDPAAFLATLRSHHVVGLILGASYAKHLTDAEKSLSFQARQARVIAIQQALAAQPGVTVLTALPSLTGSSSTAPAVFYYIAF